VSGIAATEIAGLLLTFIVVSIAAITFPYRRRSIYEGSAIERSVGGVPLITLIGGLALVVYMFFTITILSTSALGATTHTGIGALILFGLISVAAYPVVKALNKRRGVDISLASRELPPE
jgi:basic amino acid/polyamine antiporter, APA family